MGDINAIVISGHLGADPDVHYAPDGSAVTSFNLASTRHYTDRAGDAAEKTTWIRIVCFNKTAELAAEYLKKGSNVAITGELSLNEWEDGQGVQRRTHEIRANRIDFLGQPKANGERHENAQRAANPPPQRRQEDRTRSYRPPPDDLPPIPEGPDRH